MIRRAAAFPRIFTTVSAPCSTGGRNPGGIAVSDTAGPKGLVLCHKGLGLVNEVFAEETLKNLTGNIGIGHVRYALPVPVPWKTPSPLVLKYIKGTLTLAHNGNLVNAAQLRRELEETGAVFQTTIDSEVIAFYIAKERLGTPTVEEAIKRDCRENQRGLRSGHHKSQKADWCPRSLRTEAALPGRNKNIW